MEIRSANKESEKQKGHERSWEADHVLFCLGLFSIYQKDLRITNQKVSIPGSELKNFLDEIFLDQSLKLLSDVEVFCTNNSLDQGSFLRGLDSELVCVVGNYLVKSKPMTNLFEAAIRTSERALTVQEARKQSLLVSEQKNQDADLWETNSDQEEWNY